MRTLKEQQVSATTDSKVGNQITLTISDSFVSKNKLRTEKNENKPRPSGGESRIYIGSQSSEVANSLFTFSTTESYLEKEFAASTEKCYFSKKNLQEYLWQAAKEYLNPAQNYFYDISENYYNLLTQVNNLDEDKIEFTVFNHLGADDATRFFINSSNGIWSLVRKIALPHISTLTIRSLFDENNNKTFDFILTIDQRFVDDQETFIAQDTLDEAAVFPEEETDAISVVNARKGHGKYKNRLMKTMKKCPFTDIADPILIRASHCKPWSVSSNAERLNPYNGLLLTPTYDTLYDKGLISFKEDGTLMISSLLSKDIVDKLKLETDKQYDIANEKGFRNEFLKYHQDFIFIK